MSKNKKVTLNAYPGGRPWEVSKDKLEHLAEMYLVHQAQQQFNTTEDEARSLITTEMRASLINTLKNNPDITVLFEQSAQQSAEATSNDDSKLIEETEAPQAPKDIT